jgi:hypothetical protein
LKGRREGEGKEKEREEVSGVGRVQREGRRENHTR